MRHLQLLLVLCCLVASAHPAFAQADPQPADPPAIPAIEAEIAAIEAREDLDAESKRALIDAHRAAIDQLKRAEELASRTRELNRLREDAPRQIETIKAELATPPSPPTPMVQADPEPIAPAQATLTQLEQALAQATADLAAARDRAASVRKEIDDRQIRVEQIPQEISALNQRLESVKEEIEGRAAVENPTPIARAELTRLRAERAAILAEIEALNAERSSYEARRELLPLRRQRAERRVSEAEALVAAWQPIVNTRREKVAAEAAAAAERARREAAKLHPILEAYAAETARLAEQNTKASARQNEASDMLSWVIGERARLAAEFVELEQDIGNLGIRRSTGLLARRSLETIPSESSLRRLAADVEEELDATVVDFVEVDQSIEDFASVDEEVRRLVEAIEADRPEIDLEVVGAEARRLVSGRADVLEDYERRLNRTIDDYKLVLEELRREDRKNADGRNDGLIRLADRFRTYIEERIFWLRSVSGSPLPRLDHAFAAILWLFDPRAWSVGLSGSLSALASAPSSPPSRARASPWSALASTASLPPSPPLLAMHWPEMQRCSSGQSL